MDFDFNLILVPVTLVFFVLWLLDKLVWKQRKTRGKGHESLLIGWAYDFFPVLALVLVLRAFVVEPFNIPSGSMLPTLEQGDFILVNKFAYGIRLPLANSKVLAVGAPERGDVVVFRVPRDIADAQLSGSQRAQHMLQGIDRIQLTNHVNYIKRVIGVGGDQIVYHDGELTINGQKIARTPVLSMGDSNFERYYQEYLSAQPHLMREVNGMYSGQYAPFVNTVNQNQYLGRAGRDWSLTVPAGHYFVMGDNRDESADSRWWGFVPDHNLSGRAFYIWMHKEAGLKLPSFARNGGIE